MSIKFTIKRPVSIVEAGLFIWKNRPFLAKPVGECYNDFVRERYFHEKKGRVYEKAGIRRKNTEK